MRMKLKKKYLIKFEELLDKINSNPFICTHIKPRNENTLEGKNIITTTLESGKEIALFYDMKSCFVCLRKNNTWFDIIGE